MGLGEAGRLPKRDGLIKTIIDVVWQKLLQLLGNTNDSDALIFPKT